MSNTNSTDCPPCVYFVRFGESGPIKIGKTNRGPFKRLSMIQSDSPVPVHLMAIINEPDEDHCEKALHRRFAHLRIRGEWFESTKELTDFIADHAESCDVTCLPGIPRDTSYRQDFDCPPDESWHWDHVLKNLDSRIIPQIPRPCGRPIVAEDSAQRTRHIACAWLILFTRWSMKKIAISLGISRKTAYNWYNLALSYNCRESEALRQIAAQIAARKRSRRRG